MNWKLERYQHAAVRLEQAIRWLAMGSTIAHSRGPPADQEVSPHFSLFIHSYVYSYG